MLEAFRKLWFQRSVDLCIVVFILMVVVVVWCKEGKRNETTRGVGLPYGARHRHRGQRTKTGEIIKRE